MYALAVGLYWDIIMLHISFCAILNKKNVLHSHKHSFSPKLQNQKRELLKVRREKDNRTLW